MSIACPHCRAVMTPKGLKPGAKYSPKCPKCGETFSIVVPVDPRGTIAVGEVEPPIIPDSYRTPAVKPPDSAKPSQSLSNTVRDPAGKPVGSPGEKGIKSDPSATGDLTEDLAPVAKARETTDPQATGDYTEGEAEEKKESDKKRKTKKDKSNEDVHIPERLGGYEVLKVLGKGGMGAVLLGRQVSLDRRVALKVMHSRIARNPSFVARFTREAYAAAQLTHHNVIQIYDIGEDQGQHFFSMEFVPGQSLMELVKKEGKLPAEMAVGYILQAARGLRYGHLQGMVHRDIKPDNLMVNAEGIVKVADLGLVKLPNDEIETGHRELEERKRVPEDTEANPGSNSRTEQLTRAGAVMGTPAYMSPEQSRDSANVDARADIYSLGCSLYVLITGKPPFAGKTALEIISKHQTEPIVPPEVVVKRVPKGLSAILLKMMAKKPEDRYQSMDEVIVALEDFLGLDKSGSLNPKEEQADQLEKCCHQFNYRSKTGPKRMLVLCLALICFAGFVGSAFANMPALAGGFIGLMVMAPIAYFIVHGTFSGSVVYSKTRAVVFGMRFFDWLVWISGSTLFLATLWLFGMLWSWLGFAALAALLGLVLWFLTDRRQEVAQEASLVEARALLKTIRLQGLDEEQLRQFVCKFSGTHWEPFYEALFGYEAKLAARAYLKGNTGEITKKYGTWREPLLGWLDSRLEARRLAKERKHLLKVEARALEEEGVSKSEARAQAGEVAANLVEQAAAIKRTPNEGREASIKAMVASVRERRGPKPGHNIAGKKLHNPWFKHFANDWFGRRLRFGMGAVLFAIGLLWMYQNDLFGQNANVVKQLMEFDFSGVQKALAKASGKPLHVPDFLPIPSDVLKLFGSISVPVVGLMLMLTGLIYFGWRPNLAAIPGAIVGIAGPMFGVPAVDPLTAQHLSLIAGAVLIVVAARFLRE